MSTVTYLGRYASVREALDDAHAAGDFTFYAPNYDIYVRVSQATEADDVLAYHLIDAPSPKRVRGRRLVMEQRWTWQEMREAI
jgi:hypothetical protein